VSAPIVPTEPRRAPVWRSRRRRQRLFIGLLIAIGIVLWLARPVLAPFIVAAVIAYAFSPIVTSAERRTGLPRPVVVGIGYVVFLVVFGVLVAVLGGPLVTDAQNLVRGGPNAIATTLRQLAGSETITIGTRQISIAEIARTIETGAAASVPSPTQAVELAARIGDAALQALLALVITFYFLVDGRRFIDEGLRLLPAEQIAPSARLLGRVHAVLGRWLRGTLFLVALVAVVVYIALGPILHVPHALAIALVTGFLEIIPVVGPIVAAAIAATSAVVQGGLGLAVVVVVFYTVLRVIEDQIVMPVVIGRAIHLHPVLTIFAVLVGLSTYGILGGLLGVPTAAAITAVFREVYPREVAVDARTEVTAGEPA